MIAARFTDGTAAFRPGACAFFSVSLPQRGHRRCDELPAQSTIRDSKVLTDLSKSTKINLLYYHNMLSPPSDADNLKSEI